MIGVGCLLEVGGWRLVVGEAGCTTGKRTLAGEGVNLISGVMSACELL